MKHVLKRDVDFTDRYYSRIDELKWLYCELYEDRHGFEWLSDSMYDMYKERPMYLKKLDKSKENGQKIDRNLLGMMVYTDCFADTLQGVREKIDYIKSCGVNMLHLMPLLESPKGKDDGGYAVSNFRKVQPELGTIEDLEELAKECHDNGISCCLDFVMNHTSEEHEWALKARAGDSVARSRYFFFDNYDIPNEYEKRVPQVFPTTAPGSFTWLDDCKKVVMTSFYPYQWDLNYGNVLVFNDMVCNLLYLANRGINVIRLDAVPYIWKELGTSCRNLPQVHTIVRMMRLITEIVCPSVMLLGEVVMEPSRVVPYFGTVEKPECHMLYNVTTMASTWNTVATKDVGLLKRQIDIVSTLPKEYIFLNYLRSHDDIGWGLDYEWLKDYQIDEVAHKRFLNDYFVGSVYGSKSRGELYNDDPSLGDARLCGTTASLCGLETAIREMSNKEINKALSAKSDNDVKTAVSKIIMLHAFLLSQSGIPMLYSGDEIGQLNDYNYKENQDKAVDSRYLHRGKFCWNKVDNAISKEISNRLRNIENIRFSHAQFDMEANVSTFETGNNHVLGIRRVMDDKELICLFNFSDFTESIKVQIGRQRTELISMMKINPDSLSIGGNEAMWLE